MEKNNTTAQHVKEFTESLEKGITELFDSDRYREYLKTMSKFYNYSINNTILIAMQKPEATLIAGYRAWEIKFGRHVKKGEKAIRIFAPMKFQTKEFSSDESKNLENHSKNEEESSEIIRTGFRAASVFDISQTEGKELPNIAVDPLVGTAEGCDYLISELIALSPVPVLFTEINGAANGYFDPTEKVIAVKDSLSDIHRLKTLIHEIAHAKLHDKTVEIYDHAKDRQTMEVEAESIAYVVSQNFGIDTSEYSFGYIAAWSSGRDMKELKASLETIQKSASEMIEELNKRLWHKAQQSYVGVDAETKHNSEVKNRKTTFEREVR